MEEVKNSDLVPGSTESISHHIQGSLRKIVEDISRFRGKECCDRLGMSIRGTL